MRLGTPKVLLKISEEKEKKAPDELKDELRKIAEDEGIEADIDKIVDLAIDIARKICHIRLSTSTRELKPSFQRAFERIQNSREK